jgi:cytosine/adenosine deaminase-related metal-dependent hydrolase
MEAGAPGEARIVSEDAGPPCTTALRAAFVIAFDEHRPGGPGFVELRDGVVLVRGSRIEAVAEGPAATDLAAGADETIDLGESLLMPGLIDLEGLVDIDHLLLDSWWGPQHEARLEWSEAYAQAPREVLTPAERSTLRRYGLVQLILHGITSAMPISTEIHGAWAETHDDLLDTARTASGLGIRTFLGPSYRSGVHVTRADGSRGIHWDEAKGEAAFADAVRFLDTAAALDDPLVTGVLVPCRVETVSDTILAETGRVSAERDALVRVHATQGLDSEIGILRRERGATPLGLLERSGLLNDRLILAHGVYLDVHPDVHGEDRGDLARLAAAGASIVHCPLTNARYAFWLEKLSQYLDAGVNTALGTDSFPPDLIRAIDTGVQLSKAQHGDLGRGLLAEYVEAATLGGARALRRPDLGRIAPGAAADLVAFSLADLRTGAIDDPVRTLTLAGTARDAHFSMVAGRTVMRDGEIPGLDARMLRAEGQRIFEKLRAAYPERDALAGPGGSTEAELFPPVFPRGRAGSSLPRRVGLPA